MSTLTKRRTKRSHNSNVPEKQKQGPPGGALGPSPWSSGRGHAREATGGFSYRRQPCKGAENSGSGRKQRLTQISASTVTLSKYPDLSDPLISYRAKTDPGRTCPPMTMHRGHRASLLARECSDFSIHYDHHRGSQVAQ